MTFLKALVASVAIWFQTYVFGYTVCCGSFTFGERLGADILRVPNGCSQSIWRRDCDSACSPPSCVKTSATLTERRILPANSQVKSLIVSPSSVSVAPLTQPHKNHKRSTQHVESRLESAMSQLYSCTRADYSLIGHHPEHLHTLWRNHRWTVLLVEACTGRHCLCSSDALRWNCPIASRQSQRREDTQSTRRVCPGGLRSCQLACSVSYRPYLLHYR